MLKSREMLFPVKRDTEKGPKSLLIRHGPCTTADHLQNNHLGPTTYGFLPSG